MRFSILTLNPGFFRGALDEGMIRIAREKGLLEVEIVPIRDFTSDRYGTTDAAICLPVTIPPAASTGTLDPADSIASITSGMSTSVVTSPQ